MTGPNTVHPPQPVRWSVWDLVEEWGWSLGRAREAVDRWATAGWIARDGTDSITGAALYPREQMETAREDDEIRARRSDRQGPA